jgi:RNA 3'-phosphate cyclase
MSRLIFTSLYIGRGTVSVTLLVKGVAMVRIDGSQGEGGGQIVRSALTMAIITGEATRIDNIRAGRERPGLRPQHLKAAEAAAAICSGRVEGAHPGSESLIFRPGRVCGGDYRFDIGTAGASTLLLQTVLLPLIRADTESHLTLIGGTHVPWSPSFHYMERQWIPWLRQMGADVRLELHRTGFYPKGGGIIKARVGMAAGLKPLTLIERGALQEIGILSLTADLPQGIADRQSRAAMEALAPCGVQMRSETLLLPSRSKGTMLLVEGHFESSHCTFFALGERGKPAERVGTEAADAFLRFLRSEAVVDEHGADQLILPLALAEGDSVFRTSVVTRHLETNIRILHHFLPSRVTVQGNRNGPGTVFIRGGKPDVPTQRSTS